MNSRRSVVVALALAVGACVGSSALAQETRDGAAQPAVKEKAEVKALSIGDRAPALQVEKFVKGEAVTGFEKGKAYVVEFWATWCGPCRKMFPHLSELQAKHKNKVTFIGVNVWEEEEYTDDTLKTVEKFVKDQGDKMAYTVAFDGKAKKTDEAYMKAAGQRGIPSSFLVDGEGRIAWIGHPSGLDKVLDEVVAGKWDIEKAKAEQKAAKDAETKRREAMKKAQPLLERMQTAVEDEKWDDAIKAIDELKALDAESFGGMDVQKFTILLNETKQYDKAYAMKDAMLANKKITENPMACNQIAWSVVDPDADVTTRNADFALAFALKADEAAKGKDAAIVDTVARCYWVKGDKAKAIELQEKAVKLCEGNEDMADMKDQLADTLKEYKDKK